jgi:hypothetical protein
VNVTIVFQTDRASWSTQTSIDVDGQTTATVAGNDISVTTYSDTFTSTLNGDHFDVKRGGQLVAQLGYNSLPIRVWYIDVECILCIPSCMPGVSQVRAPWLYAEAPITNPYVRVHFWVDLVRAGVVTRLYDYEHDNMIPKADIPRYTINTTLPGDVWWGNLNLSTPDGFHTVDNYRLPC